MELREIKWGTTYSSKKCSICKQIVKIGDKAFTVAGGHSYRSTISPRVWHRDCLAAFVNDTQGLVDMVKALAGEANLADKAGNKDYARGIRHAVDTFLTEINEKKALTKKETAAERVEREFKELQAQLQAQHNPKKTVGVKKTKTPIPPTL